MATALIATMGDNCIDVYLGSCARSAVGGNALNVAVALSRRGTPAEYVGEVGNDENGRRVLDAATSVGVGVSRVRTIAGSTWRAFIAVGERGVARVDHEDPGACGPYTPTERDIEFLAGFNHVHMANLADPVAVIEALHKRGVSTSYDYGTASSWGDAGLPRIVFASSDGDDAQARGIERARAASAHGAELVIVTLGAGGSVAVDRHRVHVQPAQAIAPVDTLGAGDSYIAAFLASHLARAPLEVAMRVAGDAASETCLHWAAWPQDAVPVPSSGATQ